MDSIIIILLYANFVVSLVSLAYLTIKIERSIIKLEKNILEYIDWRIGKVKLHE